MKMNSNVKIRGEITAKSYDQSTLKRWEVFINKIINCAKTKAPKIIRKFINKHFLSLYRFGKLTFVDEHKNVICNAGFGAIAKILTDDTSYTGNGAINKMALGTGAGSPSASDTTLFNEAYRNDKASGTPNSNIALLTAFFTESECSGTYTEFGNFIDGEAGADTGLLWSHIAGLNWVKDSNTVLVVSCKYTLQSA